MDNNKLIIFIEVNDSIDTTPIIELFYDENYE